MKKTIVPALLALVLLASCSFDDDGHATGSSSSQEPASSSTAEPSIETKDGKRYALAKGETFDLKAHLVLKNIAFEDLDVQLSGDQVATYQNGTLTRKKYGTVTASVSPKGSVFGINFNVTFAPANVFSTTYEGAGRNSYSGINASLALTEAGAATITFSGSYTKEGEESPVQVPETTYSGTFAEMEPVEGVTTNMLVYVLKFNGVEDQPHFTLVGDTETKPFSLGITKLPLPGGDVFSAQVYMKAN